MIIVNIREAENWRISFCATGDGGTTKPSKKVGGTKERKKER